MTQNYVHHETTGWFDPFPALGTSRSPLRYILILSILCSFHQGGLCLRQLRHELGGSNGRDEMVQFDMFQSTVRLEVVPALRALRFLLWDSINKLHKDVPLLNFLHSISSIKKLKKLNLSNFPITFGSFFLGDSGSMDY